ncbi:MAG: hypothetical protein IT228_11875 [Flavobacteriales bacterium]|nr:hypothetical protein [Flavobacteriales bacterium]MCC6578032.1 hypothetical protein [Flavobacteriales bacterium]
MDAVCRSLFHVETFAPLVEGRGWQARAVMNEQHPILQGHFPGRPVMPGVAMVQLAGALLSRGLGRPVHLRSSRVIKFLSPLEPSTGTVLDLTLRVTGEEGDSVTCDVSGSCGDRAVFSIKGGFGPLPA